MVSLSKPRSRTAWFVETAFCARKAEKHLDVIVRIGKPRQMARGEWACEVEATGLIKRTRVPGGSALQALCIAIEYLGDTIYAARRAGLVLEFSTGDAVPLQAYFRLREWRQRMARKTGARRTRRGKRSS